MKNDGFLYNTFFILGMSIVVFILTFAVGFGLGVGLKMAGF